MLTFYEHHHVSRYFVKEFNIVSALLFSIRLRFLWPLFKKGDSSSVQRKLDFFIPPTFCDIKHYSVGSSY